MTFDLLLTNLIISHDFLILRVKAFIFGKCVPLTKPFQWLHEFWRVTLTMTFDLLLNIGHNFLTARGWAFIFARPGFRPGQIWLKNNNTCKGPWVLYPLHQNPSSGSRVEIENVNCLTDNGRAKEKDHNRLLRSFTKTTDKDHNRLLRSFTKIRFYTVIKKLKVLFHLQMRFENPNTYGLSLMKLKLEMFKVKVSNSGCIGKC